MEKLQRVWHQLQWSVGQRGLWGTLKAAGLRGVRSRSSGGVSVHPFDEAYGTETSGLISGGGLAEGHEHDRYTVAYYGIAPSQFHRAVERWRSTAGTEKSEQYTFLDMGSGKGRALLLASELGFREVVGVELNAGLARVAEHNLERWKTLARATCPMQVIQCDATKVELPAGPLLVFLYNPFQAPVLRLLLQHLEAAAEQRQRPIDVLYVVPQQEAVFPDFPRFALLWSERVEMSASDAAADLVSSAEDRCNLYRR